MNEIEKIRAYIDRGKQSVNKAYSLSTSEWIAIRNNCSDLDAIALAFEYGRAKGYRACKAEERRKQKNG